MQAPGSPGPKILFELSQVETGRAVQDLRHGVRAKVGHGIRTPLCPRATRAKSQYKVGLTPDLSGGSPTAPLRIVGLRKMRSAQPTRYIGPFGSMHSTATGNAETRES